MQNDLISRSEAYQRMVEETEQSGKCYIELSTIGRLLNDVPTAYNVKKVVAELEEHIEYDAFDQYKEEPLINMSFEKLEDIICNGGKE